ncbi:MAG: UDP-N-acetylmuramoyl-L-alanyl-D-glutamate--2,6-diaminopimelate ligase [Anaerolineaceae bacterium]|nr:UDP-N-acetylmuramoyl-L-alanyl-D-glutamate--2,6-diaminopimelate ligase [Anaerolineaceae bacterium]
MTPTKTLRELFKEIPTQPIHAPELPDLPITGLTFDSRAVQPGWLFVAIQGDSADGHRYIPDAVQRGAAAVVGTQTISGLTVPYFQVDDGRKTLAYLSAAWFGFPARKMTVIGITGTDGKTTTSNLLYQILVSAGLRAGMISTVNAVIGERVLDTGFHVTTPEAMDVQRYLAEMVDAGLTHVVLESTSHGLAQHRVTGCDYDLGVVTNITHEHLDYHKTYEGYQAAKGRLFEMLAEPKKKTIPITPLAVLNRDDHSYDYLHRISKVRQVTYSLQSGADVDLHAEDIRYQPEGLSFFATGKGINVPVRCAIMGEFNISNILAAMATAVFGLGIDPFIAARGIAEFTGVPGRMEPIHLGQNFTAIVDFAHTPNALKVALEAAKKMTTGRVIAVFGSAGLRDRLKRGMMAEVSVGLADMSIFTAEDPRTESLDDILAEMAAAAERRGGVDGKTFIRVPDRGNAIRQAVKMADPGDLVISCGKGHEQSMCFGTTEYLWDDRTAMRAALAEFLHVQGPEMPYLPTSEA